MVMEYRKVYVELLLHVDTDGNYKPVELIWEDGRTYRISKILEKRIAPTRYVGSILDYTLYSAYKRAAQRAVFRKNYKQMVCRNADSVSPVAVVLIDLDFIKWYNDNKQQGYISFRRLASLGELVRTYS